MKPLWLGALVAGGLAVLGFFPLLGLPGGLLYEGWAWILRRIGLPKALADFSGDRAWPTAILVSLAWPWFLPLTFWIGRFDAWGPAWPWFLPAFLAWSLLVCLLLGRVVR